MEDRSSRRMRTWRPKWPARGLTANENVCALISMVARSTARSNQRPDTLMQDRKLTARRKPLATHGRTIHLGRLTTCLSTPKWWHIRPAQGHGLAGPCLWHGEARAHSRIARPAVVSLTWKLRASISQVSSGGGACTLNRVVAA